MVTKAQELFKKCVEERSKGVIKVELYPAGQLYTAKTIVDALKTGAVNMGEVHPADWVGICPPMLAYAVLGAFDTTEQQWRYIDKYLSPILERELVKSNTKVVGWIDYGKTNGVLSKKLFKGRQDLVGVKIRALGALDSVFFEALGAKPTIVVSAEVYTALQTGTVDAAYSGISGMLERKWHEVGKYILVPPNRGFMHYATFMTAANLPWWNTLPKSAQDLIIECEIEADKWSRQEAAKSDTDAEKEFEKLGGTIYSMTKEEWSFWRGEPLEKEKAYLMKICGEKVGKEVLAGLEAAYKG